MNFKKEKLFRVGIIGRPNVGKSTLFNSLIRSRKSVVKDQPGVTRDLLIEETSWWGEEFEVVDTGGISQSENGFSHLIKEQIQSFLSSFDLLVVVMDGREGVLFEDREIMKWIKKSNKDFCLVVNKIDRDKETLLLLSDFYEFSSQPIRASFEQNIGIDQIVEVILNKKPSRLSARSESEGICFAVVGKPNVGKSKLCNYFLRKKRSLVSSQAGTTVDPVKDRFCWKNHFFTLVDTAGLRRQSKRNKKGCGIEILAGYKSYEAIKKAHVILIAVDVFEGVTYQEARLAQYIMEQQKPFILTANKFDMVLEKNKEEIKKKFTDSIQKYFHFFPQVPVIFVSAHTGFGIPRLLSKINYLYHKTLTQIGTSEFNRFLNQIIKQAPLPSWRTRPVKFYYGTQTKQIPPSFLIFANQPQGVTVSYRKFLTKRIQKNWDLEEIPLRIFILKKAKSKMVSLR